MLIIISGFPLLVFFIFAFALGYKATTIFHGVVSVIAVIIFVIEVILTLLMIFNKLFGNTEQKHPLAIIWDVIMSTASSALCLYVSYLFMNDLTGYDTSSILEMIEFLVALIFVSVPWLLSVGGWMEAISDERGFNYVGLLKEICGAGIILFIAFGL